jgi:hypothetical protein
MRFNNGIGFVGLASMVGAGCGSSGPSDGGPLSSRFSLTVSGAMDLGTAPIPGAAVAVDTADGARHEATTDSDGTATFSGLDLGTGPFSFTVAAPGYVAVSSLGLTQPGGWQITLRPFGNDPTWIDVSGVVRGRRDADDFVQVSASVPSTTFDGLGAQYAIRVERDVPFNLVVAELTYGSAAVSARGRTVLFTAWAEWTHPAVTGVTNLDLVMPGGSSSGGAVGESLMPSTAQGTLFVPPSLAGARGSIFVSNQNSSGSMFAGAATRMTLNPDTADIDYEVEWVSAAVDLVTTYGLSVGGASSYVRSTGMPTGGDIVNFLDPPSVSSPLSMSKDVVVSQVAPGAAVSLNIVRDDLSTGWRVFQQGSSASTIHIPKLPSAIDPRLVLGTGEVTVAPEVCVAGADGFCSGYAAGAPATLVMP